MSKITTMVAVAAILAAAAPMANAQTSPGHERYAAVTSTAPSEIIQPDQIRASKMIGSAVYDVQNRKIGKVEDLVLNKDEHSLRSGRRCRGVSRDGRQKRRRQTERHQDQQ